MATRLHVFLKPMKWKTRTFLGVVWPNHNSYRIIKNLKFKKEVGIDYINKK